MVRVKARVRVRVRVRVRSLGNNLLHHLGSLLMTAYGMLERNADVRAKSLGNNLLYLRRR